MSDTTELYETLKALPASKEVGSAALFDRVEDIAKLKFRSASQWAELVQMWKTARAPLLPELHKRVDATIKKALRDRAQKHAKSGDFEREINPITGEVGDPIPNLANVELALDKMGVELTFDIFACEAHVAGLGELYDGFLNEDAHKHLWAEIERRFNFRPSRQNFDAWVDELAFQNQYHPVRDFLDSTEWDGVPRLDRWLVTYCGAEDTPYVRAVGSIIFIAGVRRIRQPGCKFDEMLILESADQGFGKSTLINDMAMKDEWFSDSVNFNSTERQILEGTSGKWICEYAELQGLSRSEVEKMKAHRSRRADRARLAYAHHAIERPRQNIDIGSTNGGKASQYFLDASGNRRYWPVEVKRIDNEGFRRDREQLWAEANYREAQGESIRLAEELWPAAAREQEARAIPNPYEEELEDLLGPLHYCYIFKRDLWRLLGIATEKRSATIGGQVKRAMTALGWTERNWRFTGSDGQQHQVHLWAKECDDKALGRRVLVDKEPWSGGAQLTYDTKGVPTDDDE